MVKSRLDDRHAHGVEVIHSLEEIGRSGSIHPQLRIALGGNLHTFAIFQIDDLDLAIPDHHRIGCPEALRSPSIQ